MLVFQKPLSRTLLRNAWEVWPAVELRGKRAVPKTQFEEVECYCGGYEGHVFMHSTAEEVWD